MSNIAFVFPGQGAQTVGMGRDLVEQYPVAASVFDAASAALGYDMRSLCFDGPDEALKQTEKTQPSILTVSYAAFRVLESRGIKPALVAGLSLGEYSALVAAGVLDFGQTVQTVRMRGRFMQDEVPAGVGAMAAIMGIEDEKVVEACRYGAEIGICEPANFNCPLQLVIAGEVKAVERAVEKAKELGAKKAVLLPVSAPFHTSMLKGAGEKLAVELDKMTFSPFAVPLVSNVHADVVAESSQVRDLLVRQVSSPVLWNASVEKMIAQGIDTFIEVGPGTALSKFIKRISKEVRILNVEDSASLESTLTALGA